MEGMDVADAINNVTTNRNDLPLVPVTFKAVVLSKKKCKNLIKPDYESSAL
ncbi:hypothetical protein [Pedobacter steynii]